MAEPTIEIIIAAQAKQFNAEIAALQKRIRSLEASLGKGTKRGLNNFTKATNQGQNALRDFSRVVQDAPFGIIGVGNNIQELAGSFGFLVRSSGGVGAAFRAIGAALAGPGGLILLVSAVTTALTVFAQRGNRAKKEADDLAEAFKKLNEPLETLKESTRLDIRISELRGQNLEEVRKQLIAQIREQIRLNEAKIDEAQINLANLESIRLQKTFLGGLYQILKFQVLQAWRDFKKDVENTVKGFLAASPALRALAANILLTFRGAKEIADEIAEFDQPDLTPTEEEKKLRDQINQLLNDQKKRLIEILEIQKQNTEEARKLIEAFADLGAEIAKQSFAIGNLLAGATRGGLQAITDNVTQASSVLKNNVESIGEGFKNLSDNIRGGLGGLVEFIVDGIEKLEEPTKRLAQTVQALLAESISQGFVDLFESIAGAIASGDNVFEAAGKSILETLGRFLTEFGALLITYGVLAKTYGKLQLAFLSGNPAAIIVSAGTAIAVGLAAVAAGAAISALAGGIGGGASSGAGVSGNTGQTNVGGPDFASDVGEQQVVFEIEGQKLVGVLNNTLSRRGRVSGRLI